MADFTAGNVLTAAQLDTAFNTFTINDETGTTYTLAASDAGEMVSIANNSGGTVTIPLNATVAFETGTHIHIVNAGTAGTYTIAGTGGVTLNGSGTTLTAGAAASVYKTATNTWRVLPFSTGDAPTVSGTTGSPSTSTVTVGARTGTLYDFGSNGSITTTAGGALVCVIGGASQDSGPKYGNAGGVFYGWVDLTAAAHTVTVGAAGGAGSNGGGSSIGAIVSAPYGLAATSTSQQGGAGRGFVGAALTDGYTADITGSSVVYGAATGSTTYGSKSGGGATAGRVFVFIPN